MNAINKCINRRSASQVQQELSVKPIVSTSTGFIAPLSDKEYRLIPAHSKSSITPALKSGTDYEFFTVDQRGQHKETQGMVDGRLLHCLLLEEANFNQVYMVSGNHDAIHKDNPLYFDSMDSLRSFVSKHNRLHTSLKKDCVALIKKHNSSLVSDQTKIESYEQLPVKFQTGAPTKAGIKRLSQRFLNEVLTEIPHQEPESAQKDRIQFLLTSFESQIKGSLNSMTAFLKSTTKAKVDMLNTMMPSLRSAWELLEDAHKLDRLPKTWVSDELSKKVKDDAVKFFNKTLSEQSAEHKLNENAAVEDMYSQLEKTEYASVLEEYKESCPQIFNKMFNVGGKKSDTEEYTASEVLQEVKRVYGGAPVLKTLLVDEEERTAIREHKTLISPEIYAHAKRIVDAALQHEKAGPILRHEGNMYEVSMFWNEVLEADWFTELDDADSEALDGNPTQRRVLWKGKLDVLNLAVNFIADVKFMSTVEFDALQRDASKYTYHLQNGIYEKGFNEIMKSLPSGAQELTKFIFIFIEKDAPKLGEEASKPVRIRVDSFKLSHIERAARMATQATLLTEMWQSTAHYDGFDEVEEIDVPVFQVRAEERWLAQTEQRLQRIANKSSKQAYESVNDEFEMPSFASLKAG
ncbi:PD-(D/E)XK nuclease-like domain-containing protein [Vibrio sp. TRT 29B02]|uniref:PD-(D/E)XK nuclease-like domain-containing protein n=1 Tax=Vibrio sp. TRT 29B02 TaxID=3418508 RepID=UPI003CF0C9FC